MKKSEEVNSGQFEDELKRKFIRVQPDESFVKNLRQKLSEKSSTSLENSKKYLYTLFLILAGVFSGYFLIWILKMIFHPKHRNGISKIQQASR
ncbi:MAG: hypothetical protein GYA45_11970 [Pelolinea sp.]|jgi:hypothetical protein|nr:hypothetical protein [Pelolinea sp.]